LKELPGYSINDNINLEDPKLKENFFELALDLFFMTTLDGIFIQANQAWENLLGYEKSELIGQSFFQFLHPEDQLNALNALKELSMAAGIRQFTNRFLTKTGSILFLNWRSIRKADIIYAIARDVTHEKELESLLTQTQNQFNSILNSQKEMICRFLPDTTLTFVNETYCRYFQQSKVNLIGQKFIEMIPEGERESVNLHIENLSISKKSISYEHQVMLPNGELAWQEWTDYIISEDQNGKPLEFQSVGTDITEKKKQKLQLKKEKSILAALTASTDELLSNPNIENAIENSLIRIGKAMQVDQAYFFSISHTPYGISCSHEMEWYADGRPQAYKLPELTNLRLEPFGKIAEYILAGKHFQSKAKDIPESNSIYDLLYQQNILSFIFIPIVFQEKTWGFIGFDSIQKEVEWTENEVNLLLSFGVSISNAIERNELEKQLKLEKQNAEDANKAKSIFLASMSHEIRTPLNSVIGFSDLLSKTDICPEQKKYIQAIHNSGNLLLELINDILDFSKIEAGKMEIFPEKVDLFSLIEQVMSMVRIKIAEKDIQLIQELYLNESRFVYVDSMRIKQILVNLLGNATKFTNSGEIKLKVVSQRIDDSKFRKFHFSVQDTGIGIPQEKQKIIFELFAQEDNSTTRRYGGTGLGLSICNRLLLLMNSQLYLESKSSLGSRFYFDLILPVDPEIKNAESIFEASENDMPITFDPIHVLIVDDNPVNILLAKSMVIKMLPNSHIIEAEDGLVAMEQFKKREPDLILLDIQMPKMSGYDVAGEIRIHQNKFVPIIALTAEATLGERERCLNAGMNDYLSKPFLYNNLKRIIKKYL
jgi:PAS domain S-box-containing protein